MRIGVPAEIKDSENRVAMTPAGVTALVSQGHTVLIEDGAGDGATIPDADYTDAGADLVDADAAWDADLVVKIKEPQPSEYDYLDDDTVLFTYFHLAASQQLTDAVLDSGMTAIAYETVEEDGELPLLDPMSAVAGEMAPLEGHTYLARHNQGKGVLLPEGDVTVIGGGTVGESAARVAAGTGADVTVLDIDEERVDELNQLPYDTLTAKESNEEAVAEAVNDTDVLVGAVLVPGAKAPIVVSEEMVRDMEAGSVIVDVAIDQAGCVETIRNKLEGDHDDDQFTHSNPTFTDYGVTHYAVMNMPGAYATTATNRLTDATLPYIEAIAENGWQDALRNDAALRKGLNAYNGSLTNEAVADAFSMDWTAPEDLL